jgi:hypothetical protein
MRGLAHALTAVNGNPDVAVAAKGGLPRVQSHPHAHLRVLRPPLLDERPLRRHGRSDRASGAREDSKQRVTGHVDLGTAACLDGIAQ